MGSVPITPTMDPLLLRANSGIISMRLQSILAAEQRLNVELTSVGSKYGRVLDHENLWDTIFSILDHAAALSRMFWPPYLPKNPSKDNPKGRARREGAKQLRLWLEITDGSPLNEQGRHPRNTIEHWGECCDEWYPKMAGKKVVDSIVMDKPWPGDEYYLRSYNRATQTVTYGDAVVELRPLLDEVRAVFERYPQAQAYALAYPYKGP